MIPLDAALLRARGTVARKTCAVGGCERDAWRHRPGRADRGCHRPPGVSSPCGTRRPVKPEDGEPGESDKERIDRELIELLNELRVALPGVQVLFAFLLVVPF